MRQDEPILTISVAANLLKLHPRTLMLYERSGLTLPHRTKTQRRLYSIADLDHLQFLKYLTQNEGLNLQGVKKILEVIEIGKSEGLDFKKRLFPRFKAEQLI